jgi:hypothetical protein
VIELAAALKSVVDALEGAGARYVVAGSVAGAHWGVARATRDVDIVVTLDEAQLEVTLAHLLTPDLYVPVAEARRAVIERDSFNVLHPSTGGKVDVFVEPGSDSFTRSRLDRRLRAEVLGVAVWVDTPENLILAKLRWRRTSRSEVQWRDCVELASINPLDEAYLRDWAAVLAVGDDLADLLGPPT